MAGLPPDQSGWPPNLPPLEDPQFQLDPQLDFSMPDMMQFGLVPLQLQEGAPLPPPPAGSAAAAPSMAAAGSSGGRRGQGRGAAPVDDQKLERARAANRAKQARFRARQKVGVDFACCRCELCSSNLV